MKPNQLKNTELFRAFVLDGSKEALSLFFQNWTDLFYRVALKYTKNVADAEDVIQTAFINIINKADQYQGLHTDEEKLLKSWCLSIVVQCALMKIRSDSSRRQREKKYSNENDKYFHEEGVMETTIENKIIHQKVTTIIADLPEKYRIPIHLKYVEGLELGDIADILKLNANTLRSLMKRGLEKISAKLAEEKVAITSLALISLIQQLPLETAPSNAKSIALQIANPSNSSRILAAKGKTTSFLGSTKASVWAIMSTTILVSTYAVYSLQSNKNDLHQETGKTNIHISQTAPKKETNQSWDFSIEKDRDLSILTGSWEWNSELNSMHPKDNEGFSISLPITTQEKPFVIDFHLTSSRPDNQNGSKLFLRAFWLKNKMIGEHETHLADSTYQIQYKKATIYSVYFYKNYALAFLSDTSYKIDRYNDDLEGANVAILSQNIGYQKITSRTLDQLPPRILKLIEEKKHEKGTINERISLD